MFSARQVVGAVRLTQSVDAVNDAVRRTVLGIAAVGLAVLLAALVAAFLLARGITRPIERLGAAADTISSGDLDARATVEGSREQRSLARSFNLMTERLARALRAQTEFVADASHQLRTPLTGLRLRIEEARATPDRADAERHLDAGLDELDRMSATIDDLLVLSRTGEREGAGRGDRPGRGRRRRAPALGARRGGARDRAARRARRRAGRSGRRAPTSTAPSTRSWRTRSTTRRPAARVTVRAGRAAIEVLDDGPGLAPGEEDDVFARFHRGSAGRGGSPGTGLGLPIARELMRCWGGDAALANRPEGGTRATLTAQAFTGSFPGRA